MTEPGPRIPPIEPENWTDAVRDMFGVLSGPSFAKNDQNPVLNTFAHYPELTQPFLTQIRHLLSASTLPVRLRQIAILRVAWLKKARYMWASHLRTSLSRGLAGDDFAPVKQGAASTYWTAQEQLVLRATDQLVECSDLDDELWQALSAFWDRRQMMDFLFTVGAYVNLALVLNALRVEREPELQALAERYGSPDA